MAHPTAVINVVGLNQELLGHAPCLFARARRLGIVRLRPVLPALTCSVQASMLTGLAPAGHGIVGNGWYDRDLAEVHFWKQSNRLVAGEKVWETARKRDRGVTCCVMFWWFNMYTSADWSVTPRPMYTADGRKVPDVHTQPAGLRDVLQDRLGRFPLFSFWGPGASIESSEWIAEASRIVAEEYSPTLLLVYLPHLDYGLQKLGPGHPDIPAHVGAVDSVAGSLIESLEGRGMRTIVCSEYGIEAVRGAVPVNRILRAEGLLRVREELGRDLLDPGASRAFAVADHQVAHVYAADAARAAEACRRMEGVEAVLGRQEQAAAGLDHGRSGDLVLVAEAGRWFSYGWWDTDDRAPDYARTVDIHRKPGYDPCELFLDPALRFPRLRIARRLLQRRLGFRALPDVIPLDPSLVRGSHGRTVQPPARMPVLIAGDGRERPQEMDCRLVTDVILEHLFADER